MCERTQARVVGGVAWCGVVQGNLVTNLTWTEFWMNEGFTVFVERKILQKLYGKQVRDLHGCTFTPSSPLLFARLYLVMMCNLFG